MDNTKKSYSEGLTRFVNTIAKENSKRIKPTEYSVSFYRLPAAYAKFTNLSPVKDLTLLMPSS